MKILSLPAGTVHVPFNELAHRIADALWPVTGPDDPRWEYGGARIDLTSILKIAVQLGDLPVKDPLTFGPHPFPVGNALLSALVTVDDLRKFVAGRGLEVSIEQNIPPMPASAKSWTEDKLAEAAAYREKHGTKMTAEHYQVSEQRIRALLPGDKPEAKGYSAFTHHQKMKRKGLR